MWNLKVRVNESESVHHLVMSTSFVTPGTIAHHGPLSIELHSQEYWGGLPFLPPGDPPGPGIEPMSPVSPALQALLYC